MNRKIIIAFLVGAALSMALTLLFNNSIRDAANAIGQMLGADPLTVPDSVATTSDTFVAEADCVGVIQPLRSDTIIVGREWVRIGNRMIRKDYLTAMTLDSIKSAQKRRIILPKPAHDDALTRQGRRIFNDRPEKVSEGGSGIIVDSQALQRRIQERVNQANVPWFRSEFDTLAPHYALSVTVWSATPRPVIRPRIDIDWGGWYRLEMEDRVNSSLTRSLWKGRLQGAAFAAAVFGVIQAVR